MRPDSPARLTCSRERNHRVLATCMQRVVLILHPASARVTGLEVPPIPCTGL